MKIFRFLFLLIIVTIAYSGQFIFEYRSLVDLFPQILLDKVPDLYRVAYWLPADLLNLALWMSALACTGFGMLASPWAGDLELETPSIQSWWRNLPVMRLQVASLSILLASLGATYTTWHLYQDRPETLALQSCWLLSLLFYCIGCWLITGAQTSTQITQDDMPPTSPMDSWPTLLLVLAGAGILLGRELLDLPVRINNQVAQIGLQAYDIYHTITQNLGYINTLNPSLYELFTNKFFTLNLFSTSEAGLPHLAYLPTALAVGWSNDMLLGTRAIGLLMGLLTVLATWLLGTELFRRTPFLGKYGEIIEDDGRWPALLAAIIVAVSISTIHFSRLPLYLEPVISGLFSLWALLYGLRTGRSWLLALSGILSGWSIYLLPSGLIFIPLIPLWWVGVLLLQRRWIYTRYGGIGGIGLSIWIGGLGVTLAPLIGRWWQHPDEWLGYLRTTSIIDTIPQLPLDTYLFTNLWQTLLAFNLYPDSSTLFGSPHPLLDYRLAPLLVLAFGAILLNMDRLPGWCLLTWIGSGILFSSLLNGQAPYWPLLLPIIPAAALVISFGTDRIHLLLSESIGTWIGQLAFYLVLGLALWSGLSNWLVYYELTHHQADVQSYIGRAARATTPTQTLILLNDPERNQAMGLPAVISWEEPILAFLSNRGIVERTTLSFVPEQWSIEINRPSRLLIQAEDIQIRDEIKVRYPEGQFTIILRDNRSEPMLYIYDLP